MLGRIEEIIDNSVIIRLSININEQPNLVNLHVVFEDGTNRKIVAEIANVNQTRMVANIVGEISDNSFTPGSSYKPSFKSIVRLIQEPELKMIFGSAELEFGYTNFGTSNVYDGYKINVPINDFFNSHFSVIGNSGAGKSCTVASILQKLYEGPNPPRNSSVFFFDAYGEYTNAFSNLHQKNAKLNYKTYTTNLVDPESEILRIPVWLLDVDDLALLLDATSPTQLPIIEKTLQLVPILTGSTENVIIRKNDIIARALQDILLSGADSTKIRDQVIGILARYNTPTLNLESQIVQPGYTRTLKQCLYVDKTGKMQEIELVVEFVRTYILEELFELNPNDLNPFYSLSDLELAMDFALISEGILKSDRVFDNNNVMSVRLHSLATGDNSNYFDYPDFISRDEYIDRLLWDEKTKGKVQIVNFNINYIDDRLAKVITKILSRMLFIRSSLTKPRGSRAIHIIIEEAHRYVQNDNDATLIGYNIFERISKEGRKYGIFLALISQRPSELSDTCVSQCGNFLVLRTLHPTDLQYIREMIPNISQEIVLQLKNLKPGNCIAFGSAFKVPTSLYIDLPNPRPLSNNVDLETVWYRVEEPKNVEINKPQDVNDVMVKQAQNAGDIPINFAQNQAEPTAEPQFAQNQVQRPELIQTVSNLP